MVVHPRVPLPGKIVPVVEGEVLKKIVFISVEEHVSNCAAFLDFVSPDGDQVLTDALLFHDIGKKLFRVRKMYRDAKSVPLRKWGYDASRDGRENNLGLLKRDYTATMRPDLVEPLGEEVSISEVVDAYLDFIGLKEDGQKKAAEGIRAYPVRSQPEEQKSPVIAASYRPSRPFENHASPIKAGHLPEGLKDRERLAGLIRLHHRFQVSSIVSEAATWEAFPEHLYDLMTLDHLGSSWAERLVLREEGGSKRTFTGGVNFGEIESEMEGDSQSGTNPDGTKTVTANVRLRRYLDEEVLMPLSVTYFAREVNYVDPSLQS
jgi:hypothetical protein